MDSETRDECIDSYYRALDEESYDHLPDLFTENIFVEYSIGDFEGIDEILEYYTDMRRLSNTNHRIQQRIHSEEVTICLGEADGVADSGPMTKYFADVFGFDEERERIESVSVYLRHRD